MNDERPAFGIEQDAQGDPGQPSTAPRCKCEKPKFMADEYGDVRCHDCGRKP